MTLGKRIEHVTEIAYHRNGMSGIGFHAIRFVGCPSETSGLARFLAIVTEDEGGCFVICEDLLAEHGVRFGFNSWRGDNYEEELREAIAKDAEQKWGRDHEKDPTRSAVELAAGPQKWTGGKR